MCLRTNSYYWGLALVFFLFSATNLHAKEAVPMAADPELEKQVKDIAEELRCLVCQNQTIADSDAGLAVDLKHQVRTMVSDGKSEDEILDYMVERYGDFVRYRPPVKPLTYALWGGPFILLALGLFILFTVLKNRKQEVKDVPLSEEENNRLQSILAEKTGSKNKNSGGEGKES